MGVILRLSRSTLASSSIFYTFQLRFEVAETKTMCIVIQTVNMETFNMTYQLICFHYNTCYIFKQICKLIRAGESTPEYIGWNIV